MSLWNIRNLSIPPINTYKAINTKIDINYLNKIFLEAKIFFDNENYMRAEYAVLSTIVYRSKQKFRSAKDFKALEKVYKALGIYLKSNVSCDLKKFMDLIPSKYRTDETYLPNKNILDYILVRLQGLVKLLERIVETCKIAAYLFDRRMHTGHFWKIAFIIFSVVSRIYVVAKYSTKFICDFYNKVVPFSRQLKNNGRNWLPTDYILPNDLQQWMNVDWLDVDDELQVVETWDIPDITQFIDLVDDDIQFCDEYIMVCDDEKDVELDNEFRNNSESDVKQNIAKLRGFDFDEDIGEVIELDDSSVNPIEIFPQEDEENDLHYTVNSSSDDSDGIIEIDDSVHLLHDNSSENINEIINLNDSSVYYGKDIDEVPNCSNSFQTLNENALSQNVIDICDSSSQSIIILDNSLTSESQSTNCEPLWESENNSLKISNPVHFDETGEIKSDSVMLKKQKKMERALINKQKKRCKIKSKIIRNQLNKENNSTFLPNLELNKKVSVNGSSTLNCKADTHTNILINNKHIHRDPNKLLMKKDKQKIRKRKQKSQKTQNLHTAHERINSNLVNKISENISIGNEKMAMKMNRKKKNNNIDARPNETKLRQTLTAHDYHVNNRKRNREFNTEGMSTRENQKRQKIEGIPTAKVNRKKQKKINSKLKLQKKSERSDIVSSVRKNNIRPVESKKDKLKLLDNAVKFSQQANISGVPKDNNRHVKSKKRKFKSLNNAVKPSQQKNIDGVPYKDNKGPVKSKKRKFKSLNNPVKLSQQKNVDAVPKDINRPVKSKNRKLKSLNNAVKLSQNNVPKDNNRPAKFKKGKLKSWNNTIKLPQETNVSGVQKNYKRSTKSKKKKLKSLGNIVKVSQQAHNLKHIVNQVHYNTQNVGIKSKPKKKNKYKKNKQ